MVLQVKVFTDKPENLSSDRRKESTSVSCSLISKCMLWNKQTHTRPNMHMRLCTHTYSVYSFNSFNKKKNRLSEYPPTPTSPLQQNILHGLSNLVQFLLLNLSNLNNTLYSLGQREICIYSVLSTSCCKTGINYLLVKLMR